MKKLIISSNINFNEKVLGSKTLGTNVLEFQFVICWQTIIKT